MTYLRLKIGPMRDFEALAQRFDGLRLEFLSAHQADETVASVIAVYAEDVSAVVDAMMGWDAHAVAVIETTTGVAIVRVRGPVPEGYRVIEDIAVPPLYPIVVTDGHLHVEYLLPEPEVSTFHEALVTRGVQFTIEQVSSRYAPDGGVTPRQQEVVSLAVEHGYYELPRRTSQAELATRLEVDTSVVNRILRRAEGQLIPAATLRWSGPTGEG
jgi:Predicted DNA binding protein